MDVQNGYVRSGLPEFLLDKLIIEDIAKDPRDEKAQRAYAYYYGIYKAINRDVVLKEEPESESDGNGDSDSYSAPFAK